MAPKGESSKKPTPKKNTQKNCSKITRYLINEDINESSGDLEKYPNMGQVEPRDNKPQGKKVASM